MRILFITNSLSGKGGIEKVTIVKANAFAEAGNEVGIACCSKDAFPDNMIHPLDPAVKTFECGVALRDLSSSFLKNLIWLIPLKFIRLRQVLIEVIKKFVPDVVISVGEWEMYPLATISLNKILRCGKHVKVREFHFGSQKKHYINPSRFHKMVIKIDNAIVSRCFDANFLLTKEDKETNFPDTRRFDYQWNPCTFSPSEYFRDFSERDNTVVMVCRLNPQKYIDAMLRVWSQVQHLIPDWKLKIVGEGDQKDFLITLRDELGLKHSVEFLGYRNDIPDILQNCKILASTSKHEGMPLNIIEAMMAGVVPISFMTPYGPSDIIENGISGVLVDFLNENQFAEKLVGLIVNKDLKQMSINANKRAQLFKIENIVSDWMRKYTHLLEK